MKDAMAPGLELSCDGAPLSRQTVEMVTEVMVESRLDLPGSFALWLTDAALASIDRRDGKLQEGVRLDIALGYAPKFRTLITGEIGTVSAEMSPQGVFARVAGFDLLHRLARGTNYRRYESGGGEALTDSAIARSLLSQAGLRPTVDETPGRSVPRTQDNRSDLDFLAMLAGLNSCCLYSEGDRAFFMQSPPDRGEARLRWGENLRTFYPRLCLDGRVRTLEVRGRDASLDENYSETVERPREELLLLSSAGQDMLGRGSGGQSRLSLHDALITSGSDARQFLPGALRDRQALLLATGSCIGDPGIRAGTRLHIGGAGRFDGSYLVTRAVHRFGGRGYTTEFDARILP
ncbi:MAG: phage late control D family protein [Clostridiales bacterium]|nr:phage late control D family protein [Clostridiales bacterium]